MGNIYVKPRQGKGKKASSFAYGDAFLDQPLAIRREIFVVKACFGHDFRDGNFVSAAKKTQDLLFVFADGGPDFVIRIDSKLIIEFVEQRFVNCPVGIEEVSQKLVAEF